MKKFLSASLLLFVLISLNTKVFAGTLNCQFKNPESKVEGINSLQINEEALIINESEVIELSQTKIKCGHFGRQNRFDGQGMGLQVILKSCSDSAVLEGHMIDALNSKVAAVICNEI